MSNGSYTGQAVIVTGAAGALGQAVAAHFRDGGARVAHLDYSDELLNQSLGDVADREQHLFLAVDLTDRDHTAQVIGQVAGQWGRVDVLANIAGGIVVMKQGTATVSAEELRRAVTGAST